MHERIERGFKLYYFTVTRYNTPLFYLSTLLSTVINYFILHLGDESYRTFENAFHVTLRHLTQLVCKMHSRLPFDWRTPLGYSVLLAIEALVHSFIGLMLAGKCVHQRHYKWFGKFQCEKEKIRSNGGKRTSLQSYKEIRRYQTVE